MSLLLEQFDDLLTTPEAVDALNAQILGWAVQGRLVSQNPEDEPASVLLERIRTERAQLVKSGEIRKAKSLPPIEDDEIPFWLPGNWEWTRVGNLGFLQTGATPPTKNPEYLWR